MEEGQEEVEESQKSRTPFVTTFHPRNLVARKIIRRNLPDQSPGTFPCNRTVCCTCPHVNSSSTITTPKGHVNITGHFPVSLITWFIVCRAPNVHRQCTLERLEEGWRTALESTAEMSSKGGMTFLYLPISTKPIIHWRTWRLRYWRQA